MPIIGTAKAKTTGISPVTSFKTVLHMSAVTIVDKTVVESAA